MTRAPALVCCLAWSGTLAAGVVLAPGRPAVGLLAIVAAAVPLALAPLVRPAIVPLAIMAGLLGLARSELPPAEAGLQQHALADAGLVVTLRGEVADEPRDLGGGYEALVTPAAVASTAPLASPFGNVLVRVRGPGAVGVGDEVEIAGKLQLPADQPGFDRRAYLAQRRAYLEMRVTQVNVVRQAGGPAALPGWLRERYRAAIEELLPEPHAAVLMGVVLGIRSGVPASLESDLIATGLVHLLVLSGLKVAVFARLALGLLRPLLGASAAFPVLGLMVLYAMCGGSTPAAVRAAAMGGLTLMAARMGRPAHVWTSLAVMAAAMLGWRPELAWDVGFQLSFAGTAAIILLTPPIERRLAFVPRWLREPFAVTCAAQVGTVPLMASDFHLLSPVAPLANALVLPALPAMVTGGLLLAPLAAVPELGRTLALPLAGLLAYLEQVAGLLARLPAASIPIPDFPAPAGLAYYLALGGSVAAARSSGRARAAALVVAVLSPLLIGGGELVAWSRAGPNAVVLAVGDGQAVLFTGPAGHVLVDGGPSPARLAGELGRQLPPWARRLDALAITAPTAGHISGLAGFGYGAAIVLAPSDRLPGTAWRTAALAEVAAGAHFRAARYPDRLLLAGLVFEVLSPGPREVADQPGAGYLAFRVVGPSGRAFCDLSDLDLEGQELAAARLAGSCDYLLLPSGGRSTPSPDLMRAARPTRLIASLASGRLARGLPANAVARTDQEGSITLPL